MYSENKSDSAGKKFAGALLNAVIFLGIILVSTVVLVVLYKCRCIKVLTPFILLLTL